MDRNASPHRSPPRLAAVIFCLLAALLVSARRADAAIGSFTTTAYSWVAVSDQTATRSYGPTEILSNLGTPNADDGFAGGDIIMPNQFKFFGDLYPMARICSNGWLGFDNGTPYHVLPAGIFPTNTVNAMVAPLLTDLRLQTSSRIYTGSGPGGSWVVTWENVEHVSRPGVPNTFQAVLFPSGHIIFNYKQIDLTAAPVIGVNKGDGISGYAWCPGALPTNNTAIETEMGEPELVLVAPPAATNVPTLSFSGSTDLVSTVSLSLNGVTQAVTLTPGGSYRTFNTALLGLQEGINLVYCVAVRSGLTVQRSAEVFLDRTAPTTGITVTPASPDGLAGWYRTAPQLVFTSAADAWTEYAYDGASLTNTYLTPLALPQGDKLLRYRSRDLAGNVEPTCSFAYRYDGAAPNLSVTPFVTWTMDRSVTVRGTASDGTSGLAWVSVGGLAATVAGDGSFSAVHRLVTGSNLVRVIASDLAGNQVAFSQFVECAPSAGSVPSAGNQPPTGTYAPTTGYLPPTQAAVPAPTTSNAPAAGTGTPMILPAGPATFNIDAGARADMTFWRGAFRIIIPTGAYQTDLSVTVTPTRIPTVANSGRLRGIARSFRISMKRASDGISPGPALKPLTVILGYAHRWLTASAVKEARLWPFARQTSAALWSPLPRARRYPASDRLSFTGRAFRDVAMFSDTGAPTLTLAIPKKDAVVSRTAVIAVKPLTADPYGSGVSEVRFYIGSTMRCRDLASPFAWTMDVKKLRLAKGAYYLKLIALDRAGNARILSRRFIVR